MVYSSALKEKRKEEKRHLLVLFEFAMWPTRVWTSGPQMMALFYEVEVDHSRSVFEDYSMAPIPVLPSASYFPRYEEHPLHIPIAVGPPASLHTSRATRLL